MQIKLQSIILIITLAISIKSIAQVSTIDGSPQQINELTQNQKINEQKKETKNYNYKILIIEGITNKKQFAATIEYLDKLLKNKKINDYFLYQVIGNVIQYKLALPNNLVSRFVNSAKRLKFTLNNLAENKTKIVKLSLILDNR